jgi:glycolate oxidase FAD binding subunit
MSRGADLSQQLAEQVRAAYGAREPLAIEGGASKRFYTGDPRGTALAVTGHRGIVTHEPTELVITARAGTPLAEVEATLAAKGQMLPFEPPHFGESATLGGTIACGLSGPRRPYAGSARDFVLGTTIVNGKGEVLRFGGQVMKNVAGYDISRLMVGSLGTLGVILDVSLKVLPKPVCEVTLTYALSAAEAIRQINAWARQPVPLSAGYHHEGTLYIRLSGSEKGVRAAQSKLGGDALAEGDIFWRDLREHRLAFFQSGKPLWRLSLPPATAPLDLPGACLIDWGGAQRWLVGDAPGATITDAARRVGGYAVPFRNGPGALAAFALLEPATRALAAEIRRAFDPHNLFGSSLALKPAA